jgi:hypothetical protein
MIRILLLILFMTLPSLAHALDSCVVPHGDTYYVDEHSECREVTNNHASGLDIMVPTKTAGEWSTGAGNFLSNLPAGISTSACPPPPAPSGSWSQVGNHTTIPGSTGAFSSNVLASLDSSTIAAYAHNDRILRTYSWDGTNWSQVGNSFNVPVSTNTASITALNATTIAFTDGNSYRLRTYSWDGTNWSQVGSSLYILMGGSGPVPIITALDSTSVAFIDKSVDRLRRYSWNGSNWSQVGSELAVPVNVTNLATLDSNTIVLWDNSNQQLRTYRWNGSSWSQLGNSLSVSKTGLLDGLASLNANTIVLSVNQALNTYSWDGTNWSLVDSTASVGDISIASLDQGTLGVLNVNTNQLKTYEDTGVAPGGAITSCTEAITDPHAADVTLYLQGEGTNGSTTFTDTSPSAHTITAQNGSTITTSQFQNGSASMNFNNGYASHPGSADFQFPGDFTIEAWVRPTSLTSTHFIFTLNSSTSYFNFILGTTGAGNPYFAWQNAASIITTGHTLSLNTWHHIAITREGTTLRLFKNGNIIGTSASGATLGYSSGGVGIGGFHNTTAYGWPGQIDDLRVTKGVARYTSNFTPE